MCSNAPVRHRSLLPIAASFATAIIALAGCSSSNEDDLASDAGDASHTTADGAHPNDASDDQLAVSTTPDATVDRALMDNDPETSVDGSGELDVGDTAAEASVASDARDGATTIDASIDVNPGDGATTPDAGSATEASACASKPTSPAPARSARSVGFSGTDEAYYALYNVSCQTLSECTAACVAAGGSSASCTGGSECIAGGQGGAKHCLPPSYWRNVARGTSESGSTFDAAEQTLVAIDYQDPIAFTGFAMAAPDDAQIVGIQFAVRKNADDGFAVDDAVRVLRDGIPVGIDHRQAGAWPMDLTYVTYGGPTDTWGVAWSSQDVRASGFGVSIAARYTESAGNDRAHIDSVRATVFYRTACD